MKTYREYIFDVFTLPGRARGLAYVYALADYHTGDVFYIGSTLDLRGRFYKHTSSGHLGRNGARAMDTKLATCEPVMLLLATASTKDVEQLERRWIHFALDRGYRLLNNHHGVSRLALRKS